MFATRLRRSPSFVRARRFMVSVPLTLSLVVGSIVASAAPAQAASYVSGCFRADRAGYTVEGIPVQLQALYLGTWFTIATAPLSRAGCVAWNINPDTWGYRLRLVVNHNVGNVRWYGRSPLEALPGSGVAPLGTGVVTCYGCVYY